jgi:hypothetical protein
MDVLAIIIRIAGCIFILITVLGVLAPVLFKDKKTGAVPKRQEFLIGGIALTALLFSVAWVIAPVAPEREADVAVSQPATETSAAVQSPPPKSFQVSPEAFRQSFNSIVGTIGSHYRAPEFVIDKGEVNDTFKHLFGDEVGLLGVVNKNDGTLRSIMVMMTGGGKDMAKPMAVLLAATEALNAKVPRAENTQVVVEMFKQSLAEIETGKTFENVVGNARYTAVASRELGLWFTIDPEES